MAHGTKVLSDKINVKCVKKRPKSLKTTQHKKTAGTGSRRIFPTPFKIQVLDSYRHDKDCMGNQRATARKYGIHRRQIQKWLQGERDLRNTCAKSALTKLSASGRGPGPVPGAKSGSVSGPRIGLGLGPGLGPVNCGNGGSINGNGAPAAGTVGIMNGPALNLSVRLHGDVPPTTQSYSPLIITYDKHEDHNLNHNYYGYGSYRHDPIYGVTYCRKNDPVSPDSTRMDIGFDNKIVTGPINGPEPNFNLIGSKSDSNNSGPINGSEFNFNLIGSKSDNNNSGPINGSEFNFNLIGSKSDSNNSGPINGSEFNFNLIGPKSDSNNSGPINGSEFTFNLIGSKSDSNNSGPINGSEFNFNLIGPKSDSNKVEADINFNVVGSTSNEIGSKSNYNVIKINSIANGSSLDSNKTPCEPNYNGKLVDSNINEIRSESNYNGIELKTSSNGIATKLDESNESKPNYAMESESNEVKSKSDINESIPKSIRTESDRNESESNLNGTKFESNNNNSGCLEDSTSESRSSLTSSGSDTDDPLNYSLETPTRDVGRRRSFPLMFKLEVLDGYYHDPDVCGNQRATARKYKINRRQVQKWLGQETELRDEIKLRRGELRQRLGASEITNSPVDLRTGEMEYEYPDRYGLACCYYTTCPSICCRQGEQESPLCLVKPKGTNLPKPKKDYISFRPYLDNPVVKPDDEENDNDEYNGTCRLYDPSSRKIHQNISLGLSFQDPGWGYFYDIPAKPGAVVHYTANFV
ncbi:uncharacterized protein DDB_G0292186-like [Microplitis mediator]|uniref:uncharacterized protein DDB_G0292186-like n=1 Tax=Microplitis mediator TaxID=375433 RepID=UPI002553A955|nr:uncharacterized protein DDB_G0292186-like [Microplitis mediator]